MKRSAILLAVALIAISCKPEYNGGTRLTCRFGSAVPESVIISIGEKWDTTVAVKGKVLKLELPVKPANAAFVVADRQPILFISDGSAIDVNVVTHTASSDDPNSLTSRLNGFQQWEKDFAAKTESRLAKQTGQNRLSTINELLAEYNAHILDVLEQNSDNFLGLLALSGLEPESDEQMLAALNSLGDELKQNAYVRDNLMIYGARVNTAKGKPFVDFEVVQDNGSTVRLSDFVGRGKYVLVDFWASWCVPCKGEIPYIRDTYEKHRGKKFDVVSIAVMDRPAESRKAARELGITWNTVVNAADPHMTFYGAEGIPFIVLFGPDGTILARDIPGSGIERAVAAALASK